MNTVQILLAGFVTIAYGLLQINFLEWWRWDAETFAQITGIPLEAPLEWERGQRHRGYVCIAGGVVMIGIGLLSAI